MDFFFKHFIFIRDCFTLFVLKQTFPSCKLGLQCDVAVWMFNVHIGNITK